MSYQTGTASSLADLQTTVETFAQSNGWSMTSGVLAKAGVHVKMGSDVINVWLDIGTGDDGSGNLTDTFDWQDPEYWSGSSKLYILKVRNGQTMSFPITYHLISLSNPDNIFVIVNYNIEHCQHMAFGNVQKYGTWGGGQYASATASYTGSTQPSFLEYGRATASAREGAGAYLFVTQYASGGIYNDPRPSSILKCDVDGETWRAATHSYNSSIPNYWERTFAAASMSQPYLTTLSSINLQPVMYPPVFCIGRASGHYSVAGIMPHVRYLRVDYYQPGDIITVGAQKWIVFPHTRVSDYHAGWAIKYDGP